MALVAEKFIDSRDTKAPQILVWDLLVRVGHWLLVLFFFVAYATDDDLLTIHSWAGYGVGVYIVIRLVWGVAGPEHARFTDFAYGPAKAASYFQDLILFRAKRHLGHSPAGGLMVFALLASLTLTTVSGMALLAVEENAGPLAPWLGRGVALDEAMGGSSLLAAPVQASETEDERNEDGDGKGNEEQGEVLEEIHEFFSDLTLFLVVMHIAGVLLASVVHRENLVRAMITGRKRQAVHLIHP